MRYIRAGTRLKTLCLPRTQHTSCAGYGTRYHSFPVTASLSPQPPFASSCRLRKAGEGWARKQREQIPFPSRVVAHSKHKRPVSPESKPRRGFDVAALVPCFARRFPVQRAVVRLQLFGSLQTTDSTVVYCRTRVLLRCPMCYKLYTLGRQTIPVCSATDTCWPEPWPGSEPGQKPTAPSPPPLPARSHKAWSLSDVLDTQEAMGNPNIRNKTEKEKRDSTPICWTGVLSTGN